MPMFKRNPNNIQDNKVFSSIKYSVGSFIDSSKPIRDTVGNIDIINIILSINLNFFIFC